MTGMGTGTGPREGLRERNRRRTATELEQAALRLFTERGYDAVTIDDIAGEAGVSRRTFFRYFATKEDALFSDQPDRLVELRQALAARPAEEPPLKAVREALLSMAGNYEEEKEHLLRRVRIMRGTPALLGRALIYQRSWEDALSELVADRLGVDPLSDPRPGVVAGATMAALRTAITLWLAEQGKAHLPTLAAEAFELLDGGLQQVADARGETPCPGPSTRSRRRKR
jgi:AcrR family transcriptional regulator